MQQKNAIRTVSTLALLVWILTLVIVILTISTLAKWHFFSPEGMQLFAVPNISIALVNLVFVAILGFAIGYGLWNFRTWGRWTAIVFLAFVIIDIVIYVWQHPVTFGLLLLAVASIIALYLLAWNKSVRQLFR
jgi:hypothetical protein